MDFEKQDDELPEEYFDRTGQVLAGFSCHDSHIEFMTMDGYENIAMSMAVYPNQGENVVYAALGLAEEAGEFVGKIKKIIRSGQDPNALCSSEFSDAVSIRNVLMKELGDVLWYVTAAAKELGFTLEQIAQMNIEKLKGRQDRGTLSGSGSDRLGEGDDR